MSKRKCNCAVNDVNKNRNGETYYTISDCSIHKAIINKNAGKYLPAFKILKYFLISELLHRKQRQRLP